MVAQDRGRWRIDGSQPRASVTSAIVAPPSAIHCIRAGEPTRGLGPRRCPEWEKYAQGKPCSPVFVQPSSLVEHVTAASNRCDRLANTILALGFGCRSVVHTCGGFLSASRSAPRVAHRLEVRPCRCGRRGMHDERVSSAIHWCTGCRVAFVGSRAGSRPRGTRSQHSSPQAPLSMLSEIDDARVQGLRRACARQVEKVTRKRAPQAVYNMSERGC